MNPAVIRRFWGWYLKRPNRVASIWSDERIANHGTLLATPEYRAAYLSALRSIAGMRQLRNGVVVEDRLAELRMPTLLIWGGHDHIFPASHARAAKDRIPNGRLEIFDDSGHTPQMEEPDRFNRVVFDFLQRDRLADERDRLADQREHLADQRERIADERQVEADARERALEAREHVIEDREKRVRTHDRADDAATTNQSAMDAIRSARQQIERSRLALDRSAAGLDRQRAGLDRGGANANREQALINQELDDSGQTR
jgi:hypothetical protein